MAKRRRDDDCRPEFPNIGAIGQYGDAEGIIADIVVLGSSLSKTHQNLTIKVLRCVQGDWRKGELIDCCRKIGENTWSYARYE